MGGEPRPRAPIRDLRGGHVRHEGDGRIPMRVQRSTQPVRQRRRRQHEPGRADPNAPGAVARHLPQWRRPIDTLASRVLTLPGEERSRVFGRRATAWDGLRRMAIYAVPGPGRSQRDLLRKSSAARFRSAIQRDTDQPGPRGHREGASGAPCRTLRQAVQAPSRLGRPRKQRDPGFLAADRNGRSSPGGAAPQATQLRVIAGGLPRKGTAVVPPSGPAPAAAYEVRRVIWPSACCRPWPQVPENDMRMLCGAIR
jgi:hypothetical protein